MFLCTENPQLRVLQSEMISNQQTQHAEPRSVGRSFFVFILFKLLLSSKLLFVNPGYFICSCFKATKQLLIQNEMIKYGNINKTKKTQERCRCHRDTFFYHVYIRKPLSCVPPSNRIRNSRYNNIIGYKKST